MDIESEFVHLVRHLGPDRSADANAIIRRGLRGIARQRPDLSDEAQGLLELASGIGGLRRRASPQVPLDDDSRLALVRQPTVDVAEVVPVWSPGVQAALEAVLLERTRSAELEAAGLSPTRTLLFVGPPGVGKTMAAGWLASALGSELLVLDLAAVMSSFLGKTGNNVRSVLAYALQRPSCLLIDEFDAIAKRRDDASEIGELKRLVTVLLQAVDEWPDSHLLIAATNHPDLLDPAIWRRFDRIVEFPLPTRSDIESLLVNEVGTSAWNESGIPPETVADVLAGQSHAEVLREIRRAQRQVILARDAPRDVARTLLENASAGLRAQPLDLRLSIAQHLVATGVSKREAAGIAGVARDTLRRYLGAGMQST